MKPIRSPHSLEILQNAYEDGTGSATISRNFHLRKEQDEMLAALADYMGESKITVLRAIIDEWREMKLKGCE